MRFIVQLRSYTALVYLAPFSGGIHRFNNHNHAKNFVRYLFSKSAAHPANHLTIRNMLCENVDDTLVRHFNEDPAGQLKDFLSRRFPKSGASKSLCDDGFYGMFAVRFPDGRAFSNFLTSDGSEKVEIEHPLTEMLDEVGITQQQFEKDCLAFAGAGPVTRFEDEDDPKILKPVEFILQTIAHRKIESPGRVILTVSHRDQLDHNWVWHVHRLISVTP